MSLGWSRRAPVDTLVGTEAAVDFTIPLAELPRVSHELAAVDGEASGSVRFSPGDWAGGCGSRGERSA